MRQIILKRLEDIKKAQNGFPTSLMRWQKFKGPNDTPLKDVIFDSIPDEELIQLFERVVRQCSKQM
jgi:hypothetical protein